jgi:hypothetical protein
MRFVTVTGGPHGRGWPGVEKDVDRHTIAGSASESASGRGQNPVLLSRDARGIVTNDSRAMPPRGTS